MSNGIVCFHVQCHSRSELFMKTQITGAKVKYSKNARRKGTMRESNKQKKIEDEEERRRLWNDLSVAALSSQSSP